MASWMVHLRIADKLLDSIPALAPVEFIVGNLAPDSGVPNEDWSVFTPDTAVSHFRTPGKKADPDAFATKYFTQSQIKGYDEQHYSFYLGYLCHLLTDALWSRDIARPAKTRFAHEFAEDPGFFWTIKKDWYDLDFKYLRDHPGCRAFRVYLGALGFQNKYMDEFSPDAFDNRRDYITNFYLEGSDGLDRTYPYLTQQEMDDFVNHTASEILDILHTEYMVKL